MGFDLIFFYPSVLSGPLNWHGFTAWTSRRRRVRPFPAAKRNRVDPGEHDTAVFVEAATVAISSTSSSPSLRAGTSPTSWLMITVGWQFTRSEISCRTIFGSQSWRFWSQLQWENTAMRHTAAVCLTESRKTVFFGYSDKISTRLHGVRLCSSASANQRSFFSSVPIWFTAHWVKNNLAVENNRRKLHNSIHVKGVQLILILHPRDCNANGGTEQENTVMQTGPLECNLERYLGRVVKQGLCLQHRFWCSKFLVERKLRWEGRNLIRNTHRALCLQPCSCWS